MRILLLEESGGRRVLPTTPW